MELPKNITQIGETNHSCRIYVEDYVITYIKELNGHALDKDIGVALFGNRKEEAGVVYMFLYGACKINYLQRECRHLSQAILQEVEKNRKKYFEEYSFLGYAILNGELVEGFQVYEQGSCRYIAGYAQFYEKNDSMLRFMVAEREEVKPEEIDLGKYEAVRQRQEERRQKAEELAASKSSYRERFGRAGRETGSPQLQRMKMMVTAAFALLCIAGLATMNNGEGLGKVKEAAKNMIGEIGEKQLPDAVEVSNGNAQVGSVVTEDKLTDAILKENEASVAMPTSAPGTSPAPTATPATGTTPEPTATPVTTPVPTTVPEATPAPVSYTVKRGDTLIGICLERYGSDAKVAEICELNGIKNPDKIKIGQKILLPR